jgi:predicted RND superfamily exporter protein
MTPIKRIRPEEVNPWFWRFYGDWTCRRWRSVMFCSILVPVICGLGLQWFRVETKVIRYFPAHSQLVRDFQKMEDSLTGICPVEVVVRFNAQAQSELRFLERMEIVRQIEEEVRRHPEVSGTLSLADFQPVREPPVASASAREKILYNRRSHESEERIKSGKAAGAAELVTMTRTSPLPGDAPRVDPDELWRINAQCAILSDVNYDTLTRELQDCVQRVAGKHAGIDQFVTGTVPLFLRTQRAVLDSLIWSFVMAFGLIALVMVWVLKDPIAGLISMVPNVLPVLSVFGLVSWCGQKIDIGTMVTASVALGIAVDGTLHLLTWFQDGLRRGLTRQQSIVAALAHCGPAMWQTSAAVGIGLLVLFPADLLLISRFGWLMAALIGAALLGDVVLLPSLLMGSLGALIERGLRRRGEIPAPAGVNAVLPAAQLKRAMAETRAVG